MFSFRYIGPLRDEAANWAEKLKEVQEYCRRQWAEKEQEIKSMYNTGHRVTSKWQHFRKMLWILLEDPLSSVAAKVGHNFSPL